MVKIDTSLVTRLITAQFPQWRHLPVEPVEFDGWDNRTFRLGDDMSVRLPGAEHYTAQVTKEQRWLPRLAPLLPLPIPAPLAMGIPGESYPWHWSIYRWLEGENATIESITDLSRFAITLGQFLVALRRVDPVGGPPPGSHNFFRGGPLATYDAETRGAIEALQGRIDTDTVAAVWAAALETTWQQPPVWLHGDVSPGNLLVTGGRLSAIIDFGCSAVGDPACDLTIAWTLFSGESREAFRAMVSLDGASWARARGWALWKALITLVEPLNGNPLEAERAQRVIDEILAEWRTPC